MSYYRGPYGKVGTLSTFIIEVLKVQIYHPFKFSNTLCVSVEDYSQKINSLNDVSSMMYLM